jgi:hypothetical protein
VAVTTQAQEVQRLRSYLNPYLQGKNVNAVLSALATASTSLVNLSAAVNDNLYISTASGTYLDQLLSNYGITRPENVGLPDDIFREIGIEVKNRKQVRDLLNHILNLIFGDEYTRATNKATAIEPYDLADGDTLIINFDDNHTATITFSAAEFTNIDAALAEEVANAITISLRNMGFSGTAISQNDGNGNYVAVLSDTIGPSSSVTIEGGSAQNELLFSSILTAGGNMFTQWTVSLQPGIPEGTVRFIWSGGANPNLGKVQAGDYVNIFGGGFASSPNEGSYTIVSVVGGGVGVAYFDIQNPFGSPGIVTQGTDDAVLFFNPVKEELASNQYYAAVYQVKSRMLQIFLPATTQVIGRTNIGAAFIPYIPRFYYTFNANPSPGDMFAITTATTLVAGTDFAIGATVGQTLINMAAVINEINGLDAVIGAVPGSYYPGTPTLTVFQGLLSLTLVGTYSGSASITSSGVLGDTVSLEPNALGPNVFDPAQGFVVSHINTTLTQELNADSPDVFTVASSAGFPNSPGYLIFGYGTQNQEGPVPYVAVPSSNTLLLSPIYTIKTPHPPGTNVFLVASNAPVVLPPNGSDYEFWLTDVVAGRIYAQDLIQSVTATGISIVFTILYPSALGLGGWSNPIADEIAYIYGE